MNQVDLHGKNTGIYSNPSNHDLIWLLWMCVAYPMFQGICITLVPLRMASLEFDETTVGLIQALPGVTVILLGPPFAQMSNTRWRGYGGRAQCLGGQDEAGRLRRSRLS